MPKRFASLAQATYSRAYSTEALHRLLPWPVAASIMDQWAARLWERDPVARADAIRHMRYLLGPEADESVVEAAGRRYMDEAYYRRERWYRPWLTTKTAPQGMDVLRETLAAGKGALVNFMHYGEIHGPLGAIGRTGIPFSVAAFPEVMQPSSGTIGKQIVSTVTYGGGKIFPSAGSREHVRTLLLSGSAVAIASDVPSSTFIPVLGIQAGIASGAARLAMDTGVLVFPLILTGIGKHPSWRLDTPIDPAGYDDPIVLLREMMRRHEPGLRLWPESVEKPLKRWTLSPEDQEAFGWFPEMPFRV